VKTEPLPDVNHDQRIECKTGAAQPVLFDPPQAQSLQYPIEQPKIVIVNPRPKQADCDAVLGPDKISVARLPVTGSGLFGRDEDIALLDGAWARRNVNIVTIVAWAGVGKSTLVNHWLGQMA
jgi:hypothetical protein